MGKFTIRILGLMMVSLLLFGCATNLTNIKRDYLPGNDPAKTLVFGEIEFKDFQHKLYNTLYMNLVRTEDKRDFNINVSESSYWQRLFPQEKKASIYFFIELPRGRYMFKSIMIANWQVWWPGINFTVTPNTPILYIGTAQVCQTGNMDFWSSEAPVTLNIVDNYNVAKDILKNKYPNIDSTVIAQLMKRQSLSCVARLDPLESLETFEKDYRQYIVDLINSKSYIYFSRLDEGEVVIGLKIKNTGKINQASINNERSASDLDLQKLAISTVKRGAPFMKFPESLKKEEIQFTIIIDFKLVS